MSKIKGISLWEQYLEYIVLGVAALVFITLTTMQFIGSPNATKVEGKPVKPSEVDRVIEQAAIEVRDKIREDAESPVVIETPKSFTDQFLAALDKEVFPRESLVAQLQRGVSLGAAEEGTPTDLRKYAMIVVPPPTAPQVQQTYDSLVEQVVSQHEALSRMFTQAPFDLTWTTASAVFDIGEVRRQLGMEGRDFSAIPVRWHDNQVAIFDLVTEREEYLDGQWTNRKVVDVPPLMRSYRADLTGEVMARTRDRILEDLKDSAVQLEVVQPRFYDTHNNYWTPPDIHQGREGASSELELSEEQLRIQSLNRRLQDAQKRRENVNNQIKELGCTESMKDGGGTTTPPGRGGTGGGRGGSGGGGTSAPGGGELGNAGGAGGRSDPTGGAGAESNKLKCIRLYKQLDGLNRDIDRLQKELEALGVAIAERNVETTVADPLQQDQLLVWAHDLDVKPGRTYRYRFIIKVHNPFFGRRPLLTKEQQQFADSVTISSVGSEWSEPVEVQPPLVHFVTKAWAPSDTSIGITGGVDTGRARVEVFKFERGRWWRQDFTVKPGDQVGRKDDQKTVDGSSIAIDFSTDWFVLDVIRDIRSDASRAAVGLGALVLLQNMRTGEVSELRDPGRETGDRRRDNLINQVDLSRPVTAVASSTSG